MWLVKTNGVSIRKASFLIGISMSCLYHKHKRFPENILRDLIIQISRALPQMGAPRIYQFLRARGYYVNHKRVERIYYQEGLELWKKAKASEITR